MYEFITITQSLIIQSINQSIDRSINESINQFSAEELHILTTNTNFGLYTLSRRARLRKTPRSSFEVIFRALDLSGSPEKFRMVLTIDVEPVDVVRTLQVYRGVRLRVGPTGDFIPRTVTI